MNNNQQNLRLKNNAKYIVALRSILTLVARGRISPRVIKIDLDLQNQREIRRCANFLARQLNGVQKIKLNNDSINTVIESNSVDININHL